MAEPFNVSAEFSVPPYTGTPECPVPLAANGTYESKGSGRLSLSGTGTAALNFGGLAAAGAKLVVVQVAPDASLAAQPVDVTFNGSSDAVQLSPGGFLLVHNPKPTASGLLSGQVAHTANAIVWYWVFG